MTWDPSIYNKFKAERFAPFNDLSALVNVRPGINVIDLGCGTGELTRKLSGILPGATILGIDNSTEMLKDSTAFEHGQLKFECRSVEEQCALPQTWDLIFSNAALQWVDDHEKLLSSLINLLNPGGQLLIQVPAQHHNITNQLLDQLAEQSLFKPVFENWKRTSPVLSIERYAALFFEHGCEHQTACEKIYPAVMQNIDGLYDWVSGTAVIPYLERLPEALKPVFIKEYKILLGKAFTGTPVFYPFKRIILEATFKG